MVNQIALYINDEKYRTVRFCTAFAIYFCILIFGSLPRARAEIGMIASGFLLHTIAYSAITFLLATGSRHGHIGRLVQAVLIVMAMGAADEYLQSFFPYRTAALSDWLVDVCASLSTALLVYTIPLTCKR